MMDKVGKSLESWKYWTAHLGMPHQDAKVILGAFILDFVLPQIPFYLDYKTQMSVQGVHSARGSLSDQNLWACCHREAPRLTML
jgi:hypothetical protein